MDTERSDAARALVALRWGAVERVDKPCAGCERLMRGVVSTRTLCNACRIKAWRKARREQGAQGETTEAPAGDLGEPRFCELPGCGHQLPAAARKDARYCSREHKEQARRLRAHSTPESFT